MSLGRILMSWDGTRPNCQTFSIFSDNPLISFRHSKNILETLVRRSLPLDSSSEMVRSLDGCLDVKLDSSYIPLLPFRHINLSNTKHLHFTGTSSISSTASLAVNVVCFLSGKLEDFWGYGLVSVGVLSLYIWNFSNEYEIRQVKRMVYAYAIRHWHEKVVAIAHLSMKLWRNLVRLLSMWCRMDVFLMFSYICPCLTLNLTILLTCFIIFFLFYWIIQQLSFIFLCTIFCNATCISCLHCGLDLIHLIGFFFVTWPFIFTSIKAYVFFPAMLFETLSDDDD
jgi:hypothetical protein